MDRYEISEVNLGKNEYICSFKFFFKTGNYYEHP